MNRLQKKCLIAAAGSHLLIVVVLLCSGFISSKPKTDDSQVLEIITLSTTDANATSGVRNAPTPPPANIPQPPQPPTPPPVQPPEPPKPQPPQEPPKPEPAPDSQPADQPVPKPPKKPHEIHVDLSNKVTRTTPKDHPEDADAQAQAEARAAQKAANRAREARARAFASAATSIRDKASSATSVDVMPGTSSASYANYGSVILSIYNQAWKVPDTVTSDDAIVKVKIVVSSEGEILHAQIIDRCGDSSVNGSVQRALDRVSSLPPFPDGATEKVRTYIINFDLKAKLQMMG